MNSTEESVHMFLQLSLVHGIQECYCRLDRGCSCTVRLLPQVKVLHLAMSYSNIPTDDNTDYTDKYSEIEKCLEMKSTFLDSLEMKSRNEAFLF